MRLRAARKTVLGAVLVGVFCLVCLYGFLRVNHQRYLDRGIIKAVEANDVSLARQLLEQGANIDTARAVKTESVQWWTWDGLTTWWFWRGMEAYNPKPLLYIASHPPRLEKGDIQMFKLLLSQGAKPDEVGPYGDTPLMLAAGQGNLEAVRLLLDKGAVTTGQVLGVTPLMVAASAGGYGGIRPAGKQAPEVIRLLFSHGADINAEDNTGLSSVARACMYGNRATVRALLEAGAKVKPSHNGENPLRTAALYGDPEIVKELLKRGADINAVSPSGRTPLMAAASRGPRPHPNINRSATVRLLLAQGAQLNARDSQGKTPLTFAVKAGDPEIIQILRAQGAKQ